MKFSNPFTAILNDEKFQSKDTPPLVLNTFLLVLFYVIWHFQSYAPGPNIVLFYVISQLQSWDVCNNKFMNIVSNLSDDANGVRKEILINMCCFGEARCFILLLLTQKLNHFQFHFRLCMMHWSHANLMKIGARWSFTLFYIEIKNSVNFVLPKVIWIFFWYHCM